MTHERSYYVEHMELKSLSNKDIEKLFEIGIIWINFNVFMEYEKMKVLNEEGKFIEKKSFKKLFWEEILPIIVFISAYGIIGISVLLAWLN